ncbi:MAG: ABC transporter ATP-binding protein [Synechococcales cyanobacterium T60_A2020_003]|nr:ABC transporter ATP-binding protein [Synechococcales cyanobacterium T60_A2020_003]
MSEISFKEVTLTFPGAVQAAVNHCSFEVNPGEFVVILGASGCGKTTLLKMVNRLYEPTSGQIYFKGINIRQLNATTLRRQMGYVLQQAGLFPHMTVAQNIAVVPKLLNWPRRKIQARVDELLMLIKLAPEVYRDRYPSQLSGGQQQRVGIARALAGDPELLLMDEPFGALDAITRKTLQDELLRLQRQLQKTILFVSHDVEEALRLADRILIMRRGEILQFDTPLHILDKPANSFVHDLLGADDRVRQLGLQRVDSVMIPMMDDSMSDTEPAIAPDDSLRSALSLLLKTGASQLIVRTPDQVVGLITLEQIRHSAQAKLET